MDIYCSFVDVSKMIDIVELYMHAPVWLANRWQSIVEVELLQLRVVVLSEVCIQIHEGICWFILMNFISHDGIKHLFMEKYICFSFIIISINNYQKVK